MNKKLAEKILEKINSLESRETIFFDIKNLCENELRIEAAKKAGKFKRLKAIEKIMANGKKANVKYYSGTRTFLEQIIFDNNFWFITDLHCLYMLDNIDGLEKFECKKRKNQKYDGIKFVDCLGKIKECESLPYGGSFKLSYKDVLYKKSVSSLDIGGKCIELENDIIVNADYLINAFNIFQKNELEIYFYTNQLPMTIYNDNEIAIITPIRKH